MKFALAIFLVSLSFSSEANWDKDCLAHVMYLEARGEKHPEVAMRAVGHVVLTRVNSPNFPNTVCDVVWQPSNNPKRPRACAFSALCDPVLDIRVLDKQSGALADKLAQQLMTGLHEWDITMGADHYLRCDIKKSITWVDKMTQTAKIGAHCYYREDR